VNPLFPKLSNFYKDVFDRLSDGVYFVDKERQITFWNAAAERITGYQRDEVLGSSCRDGILQHVDAAGTQLCICGCPLGASMEDGMAREAEVYLHHKSGHRIPVLVRSTPIRDENQTIIGAVEIFVDRSDPGEALQRVQELEHLAFLDPLTGAGNRRFAEHVISQRMSELKRNQWRFGICFLDIDHFKGVNDRHGHKAGDSVLQTVAKSVMGTVRTHDFVARWGGEEFMVVVSQKQDSDLRIVAERIRSIVAASDTHVGTDTIKVTVSIGVSTARPGESAEALVARADSLMYISKKLGRNRVTVEEVIPANG
jgi:diguanylate cyclase (GGDEF)-like protein/PAS domain S-box-containing protein